MNHRFADKAVLITGAGSGIGRACAQRFAAEGASICAVDRDLEAARTTVANLEGAGKKFAVGMDVALPSSVDAGFAQGLEGLGSVDVVVNSAGIREIVSCLELSADEWTRVISVNLTGTFLVSQVAARHMVERQRGGKIVNLASVAGLTAVPNRAAYVASKHGVVGLTKEMALELGPHNIQINAVCPGVVQTSMTADYFDDPARISALEKVHVAGRWAQPEEIANVIAFLASAEAAFITGSTYPVDGGFLAGRIF